MDGKYISKKGDGVGNCPFCRGVILKDFRFDEATGKTTFTMRCPHCQQNIMVILDKGKIVIQEPSQHQ